MITRFTIVEFCRWIAGEGSRLARLRHYFFASSSSKSKLTVLSAFLLFLVAVAASLLAISYLLPLNSSPATSSLSPSPSSSSSSSSALLSWFFFSPSSSNHSSNSTTPPPPPPPQEEKKKKEDDVVVDPSFANQGGVASESGHGGDGDAGAKNSSSTKGSLSGIRSDQGWGNSTKNSALVPPTDRSSGGETSGEVVIGKSFSPESAPSNITSSSCGGVQDQPVARNSTILGACFRGQIAEKKSGTKDADHQIKQQQQQQQKGERNKGGRGGGRLSNSVEKAAPPPAPALPPPPASGPSGAAKATGGPSAPCDIFNGRWVRDEGNYPYYPPGSCPYLDDDFNCHKNGRPDSEFLKWRWQPYDCDTPRLNASDFLGRLRGKRLVFVGDSLNRNMWESLVCILRHSIKNKKRVYEVSGRTQFKTKGRRRPVKTRGYYSFRFADYECSVDFVRSTFLVRELQYKNAHGSEDERLRLDILDETTIAYHEADVIVFNTGHWWTHEKTSRGIDYYQEGNHVYPVLKVMEAYKKALTTWSRWIDKNIDSSKTQVVFRGYSLTHFRGGQWNSGGQCHKETEPIFNQSYLAHYPWKMRALEQILKQMRTPVMYLNISRLTDYRKDGHPSIYRKKYESVEEQIAAEKYQDCSHWCLPGVPDSWNELLYASLLIAGKGSWGR